MSLHYNRETLLKARSTINLLSTLVKELHRVSVQSSLRPSLKSLDPLPSPKSLSDSDIRFFSALIMYDLLLSQILSLNDLLVNLDHQFELLLSDKSHNKG